MTTEDKFVLVLAGFSVGLLIVGTLVARTLSTAPPRVMRTWFPVAAVLTASCYAALVFVARTHVKG